MNKRMNKRYWAVIIAALSCSLVLVSCDAITAQKISSTDTGTQGNGGPGFNGGGRGTDGGFPGMNGGGRRNGGQGMGGSTGGTGGTGSTGSTGSTGGTGGTGGGDGSSGQK